MIRYSALVSFDQRQHGDRPRLPPTLHGSAAGASPEGWQVSGGAEVELWAEGDGRHGRQLAKGRVGCSGLRARRFAGRRGGRALAAFGRGPVSALTSGTAGAGLVGDVPPGERPLAGGASISGEVGGSSNDVIGPPTIASSWQRGTRRAFPKSTTGRPVLPSGPAPFDEPWRRPSCGRSAAPGPPPRRSTGQEDQSSSTSDFRDSPNGFVG